MPTLVVPDTAQIGIEMTASGQKVMNVIGVHKINASGTLSPTSILTAVKTAWEAANGPLSKHTTTTHMVGYHYLDLSTATGLTGFLGSGASGTVFNDINTMDSCAIVKISDGSRARSHHGRLFHGPLAENWVQSDGRLLDTTLQSNLTDAYNQFKNALIAVDLPWTVISRKFSSQAEVNSVSVPGLIGTQRRRLR
jgi:hypothetical protein